MSDFIWGEIAGVCAVMLGFAMACAIQWMKRPPRPIIIEPSEGRNY